MQQSDDKMIAYLLMRTDLVSMGLGKSRAQAMHAGNKMTYDLMVQPLLKNQEIHPDVMEWHSEGAGFGTAIALGAENQVTENTLRKTVSSALNNKIMCGIVEDDTYPYEVNSEIYERINPLIHTREPMRTNNGWRCFARETTCAWFLGRRSELHFFLRQFDLTPNT